MNAYERKKLKVATWCFGEITIMYESEQFNMASNHSPAHLKDDTRAYPALWAAVQGPLFVLPLFLQIVKTFGFHGIACITPGEEPGKWAC
jgi:hypothetical protein